MNTKTEAPNNREALVELVELTRAVRAHVAWQAMTGAHALPSEPFELQPQQELRAATPAARVASASLAVAATAPTVAISAAQGAGPTQVAMPNVRPVHSLELVREEAAQCTKCALHTSRTQAVFERGNPSAALMIVGEGPGAADDAGGQPFIGPAGELLDRMIAAMGLSPSNDVYICNAVKCRGPEDRKASMAEVRTCAPFAEEQIAAVRPKVILAMGNTAITSLLGTSTPIGKLRGQWKLYKGETLLMPTYHPSFLLRASPGQAEAKRQTWEDLQMVMMELGLPAKA